MVDTLRISDRISIPLTEIDLKAVRSQGSGGQNVNKVSSAIHLRFDAAASPSLPEAVRERLLTSNDSRISASGLVTIKAQQSRSQAHNRKAALNRLRDLISQATVVSRRRIPTTVSKAARRKRRDAKVRRSVTKSLRRRPDPD